MKITGLDLSLTSTGVAHIRLERCPITPVVARLRAPDKLNKPGQEHQRLAWLLAEVGNHTRHSAVCALEGPSYGSPNAQHKMGGLWWLVAHGLYRRGIPYVVITPNQLQIYATGKARPGKDAVLAAVVRRYLQVEVTGNDVADALVLAAMTAHKLGSPLADVPKTHSRALELVNWPEAIIHPAQEVLRAQSTGG